MFLDWFGLKDSGELRLFSVGHSAWEALDYIPIVLVVAIVVALVVASVRPGESGCEPPVPAGLIVAVLGAVSVLLVLFRIVFPPNFGSIRDTFGTVPIEGTVQSPILLGLAAAAGIAFGGCWVMREEGISLASAFRRRR